MLFSFLALDIGLAMRKVLVELLFGDSFATTFAWFYRHRSFQ